MFNKIRYAYHMNRLEELVNKRNYHFFKGDMKKANFYGVKADQHQIKLREIAYGKRV